MRIVPDLSVLHKDHEYDKVDDAFEKYGNEINSSMASLKKQMSTMNKTLVQLDKQCEHVENQSHKVEAGIRGTMEQLHNALNSREFELIGTLNELTRSKLKSLASERDKAETVLAELTSTLESLRESLETGSRKGTMMMKATVEELMEEKTDFQTESYQPSIKPDIVFLDSGSLIESINSYGKITTSESQDVAESDVGDGTKLGYVAMQ